MSGWLDFGQVQARAERTAVGFERRHRPPPTSSVASVLRLTPSAWATLRRLSPRWRRAAARAGPIGPAARTPPAQFQSERRQYRREAFHPPAPAFDGAHRRDAEATELGQRRRRQLPMPPMPAQGRAERTCMAQLCRHSGRPHPLIWPNYERISRSIPGQNRLAASRRDLRRWLSQAPPSPGHRRCRAGSPRPLRRRAGAGQGRPGYRS